jgi:hypothetical protein
MDLEQSPFRLFNEGAAKAAPFFVPGTSARCRTLRRDDPRIYAFFHLVIVATFAWTTRRR